MFLRTLAVALVALSFSASAAAAPSSATTFYVSHTGSDVADGTSPATAWRTLGRVSRQTLAPGSTVLLEGGQVFDGPLFLGPRNRGTPEHAVTIGSYGIGPATIRTTTSGIVIHNAAGFRIERLRIEGARATGSGIAAVNDLSGNVKLRYLHIDHVEIFGFDRFGVLVAGRKGTSGFANVRIVAAVAHDNVVGGITITGVFTPPSKGYANKNVYVGHSQAFENPGVSTVPGHTGDGIVVSETDGATIEHCVAHDNGARASGKDGGPVGIWAWQANRVLIQRNVSYRNHVIGHLDGGGFDLDGGVTNSVVQYNVSHDNDGPGYEAIQFPRAGPHRHNIIRFNTSRNDARKTGFAALAVYGGVRDLRLYRNTVYVAPRGFRRVAAAAVSPLATSGALAHAWNVRFSRNVFEAVGGAAALFVNGDHPGLRFTDNDYFTRGQPLSIRWKAVDYRSLSAWRAATGQERANGRDTGRTSDPRIGGGPHDPFWYVLGTELAVGSILVGAGLVLIRRLAPSV